MPPQQNKKRRLGLLIFLLFWLAVFGVAAANRQNIYDWWVLRTYQPPSAVKQLASQDTMTAYARKVFYVNKPDIEPKTTFSNNCPNNGGEQTIVLGCYHGNQHGIFILKVTDPTLNGVEQVTAAHEMLHAAYDRLSSSDRKSVDAMLLDFYNHDLHDQRIKATIAAYRKTEPNDVVNEMHSVFGTEVANLPAGLEHYYQRYFTDREQIAAYAANYQSTFTSRQTQLTQYKEELDNLQAQINANVADLKQKQVQIDAMRAQTLNEKSSGNINAYNSDATSYNSQVDAYNAEVDSTQDLISQFNQLRLKYNALVLEQDKLVNELSTNPAPLGQ